MQSHGSIGAVPCFHWTQALSEAIAEGKGLWCAALRGDGPQDEPDYHLAGCIAEGRHSPFVYTTIYDKPAVSRGIHHGASTFSPNRDPNPNPGPNPTLALLASYFDMTIAESNAGMRDVRGMCAGSARDAA